MTSVHDTHGNWVFITPIANLILTEDVNKQFEIERVLFISLDKLRRVRKKHGIIRRISKLPKVVRKNFEETNAVAVVRHHGKPEEIKNNCFVLVQNALHLITLSQLGYCYRKNTCIPAIYGETMYGATSYVFLNTENTIFSTGESVVEPRLRIPLVLDNNWKGHQRKFFFLKLCNIINKKMKIGDKWRENMKRAALLVGQSLASRDTSFAFMMNMIALEMLLTQCGDKYSDVLPERIEAFLGWSGWWNQYDFPNRIQEVYALRCELVHEGKSKDIKPVHLDFTYNLLLNLLVNLVNYPKIFSSKGKVIEFTKKVAAEHLLGQKSRVRPKRLIMFKCTAFDEELVIEPPPNTEAT